MTSLAKNLGRTLLTWVDNEAAARRLEGLPDRQLNRTRLAAFLFLHLGCLGVLWVGWSPFAVCAALALYLVRAFFLTAFYHRYFSHKTFETSRTAQFLFAVLGNTASQRGPLWWAAHHRNHHGHADQPGDTHSPHEHSFAWAHMGWITSPRNFRTRTELVPDLAEYPELRWLDRFDWVVPLFYALGLYGLGEALAAWAPSLGTNGPQLVVWGFFISTMVLFHITCMVNSIAHKFGSRRYETGDESRNNWLVAILTLGEGWHNNHHHYPNAVRQGFRWWEIDPTWYGLRVMKALGIVWNLKPVPRHALEGTGRRKG